MFLSLLRDNNYIKDFPQLADGLMVIPLPVEEQCRGVLSEPLPNLQLLTGTSRGFGDSPCFPLLAAFFSSTFMTEITTIPEEQKKTRNITFRFFFFFRLKNMSSFCPRWSRPSPESEGSVALFYAKTSILQKVGMWSMSRAAPLCVPNSKWYPKRKPLCKPTRVPDLADPNT